VGLPVTPRRVASGRRTGFDASASNVPRGDSSTSTDPTLVPSSIGSLHVVTSLVVILSSLGFMAYLFLTHGSKSAAPTKRRSDDASRRVWIDPIPNVDNSSVSFAVAEGLPREEGKLVQLARARVQEPGQSDPNKPPPLAPSKKPMSNPPAKPAETTPTSPSAPSNPPSPKRCSKSAKSLAKDL
jgi:hypothetical protein